MLLLTISFTFEIFPLVFVMLISPPTLLLIYSFFTTPVCLSHYICARYFVVIFPDSLSTILEAAPWPRALTLIDSLNGLPGTVAISRV